jgi:hypothetical protein
MKRTNPKVEKYILNKMLLGYPYSEIAAKTGLAVSTLKKIKARNKARLVANQQELRQWTSSETKEFLQRSYQLLEKTLINAENGTKTLTVKELILISNQMLLHEQITSPYSNNDTLIKRQHDLHRLLSKLKK